MVLPVIPPPPHIRLSSGQCPILSPAKTLHLEPGGGIASAIRINEELTMNCTKVRSWLRKRDNSDCGLMPVVMPARRTHWGCYG
ncbi:hypothetical protein EJB05_29758 [Eragrostis curvula]|uniref:Uncharacterized protein n=1 Tax=Eragrostis curvula TaxID=38414 RepID=A0A5J9UV32_9POAL|nr:hypothetical protein EJB05_29758 [Eragrostis curvula]